MSQDVKNILLNTANNAQDATKASEKVESSSYLGVNDGFYGDALNDSNINDIITDVIPKLIVIVGFAGYGKSTMIGSLYHYLVLGGTIDNYKLMDSDTFVGFERRIALRRLKEGKFHSSVQRTLRGDNYYLSLDLNNGKNKHKLIISDKAGEVYDDYKNSKEKAQADKALKRADNILLLVDVVELCDNVKRNRAKDSILDLIENISISERTCLSVVFTKIDLIKDGYEEICDEMVQNIETVFKRSITKKYLINSKQMPSHPNNDSNDNVVSIFKDIVKSYTAKTSKTIDLNWINTTLK